MISIIYIYLWENVLFFCVGYMVGVSLQQKLLSYKLPEYCSTVSVCWFSLMLNGLKKKNARPPASTHRNPISPKMNLGAAWALSFALCASRFELRTRNYVLYSVISRNS